MDDGDDDDNQEGGDDDGDNYDNHEGGDDAGNLVSTVHQH